VIASAFGTVSDSPTLMPTTFALLNCGAFYRMHV
jgi:hypothetical protein